MVPSARRRFAGFSAAKQPFWAAVLLWVGLAFGLAGLAGTAQANTCAPAATRGTAPSDYQDYCWLDFTGYSDPQAQAAGQPFTFALPDGSTLTLTVHVTTNKSNPAVVAHAVPSWPGAAFGNSAFLAIPGHPVLYEPQGGSTVNVTLSNIAVTPPPGSGAAAVYAIIAADGESSNQNESLTFTTNGQAWVQVSQIPNGSQYPTVSGVGTTTVTETGKSGTVGSFVFASFNNPTQISAQLVGGGLQGALFGIRYASMAVTTQFSGGRANANDQFTYRIGTLSGTVLASGTTTGSGAGPFPIATVPAVAAGYPFVVSEVLAAGSTSTLANYAVSLTCTNGATGASSTVMPTSQLGNTYTFPALQYGDAVSCVFTNTANRASLSVNKSGPATIGAAGLISYTLVASNAGPLSADGALVQDPIVPNFTPSAVACTATSGGAACPTAAATTLANLQGGGIAIPTLPSGGTVTFVVSGTAGSANITNTATISAPSGLINSNSSPSSTAVTTVTPAADVASHVLFPPNVSAGQPVTGTVSFNNNGSLPANGVTFSITLAPNLASPPVLSGLPPGATYTYIPASGVVTLTGMPATIAAGGTIGPIAVSYVQPPSGTSGVSATVNTTTVDSNPTNNAATAAVAGVPVADITTKVSFPATVNAGQQVTGTVTYSNSGPSPATGTSFSLTLPANLAVAPTISGLPAGVAYVYTASTGLISFTGMPSSLASGASVGPITVSFTQPQAGTSTVSATFSAATQDPNAANNSASATVAGAAAQVTGTVFIDTNQNAVFDAGDVVAPGATVQLLSGGQIVATTKADSNGLYVFTSQPLGSYSVVMTVPAGFFADTPSPVTTTLTGGAPNVVNFGQIPAAALGSLLLAKTTPLVDISAGQSVPYTITATNPQTLPLVNSSVSDLMPAGFRFRAGSGSINGQKMDPVVSGRTLTWSHLNFAPGEKKTFTLVLTAGSGVVGGEYVNQATASSGLSNTLISNLATATVRVVGDPTFDCPDLIGKVFDDANANGVVDSGEKGIAGVRLVTAQGLLVTTDSEGRYHITCPVIPDSQIGSNFVVKVDERTLPAGYRLTTSSPETVRLTAGKVSKLNFGVAIDPEVGVHVKGSEPEVDTPPVVPPKVETKNLQLHDTANQANFASGSDELTPTAKASLDTFADSLREAHVQRLLVTAHTDSQRLVREAKKRFVTNQQLSEARAARVAQYLQAALNLPESLVAIQGFGDSQPIADNKTDDGRLRNRRADVSVWLDEQHEPDTVVAATPAQEPSTVNSDAVATADIQVRYDPLEQAPFLNIISIPQRGQVGKPVRFTTYTNYPGFIQRAEIRIFSEGQSTQQTPIAVVPVTAGGWVDWVPPPLRDSLLHLTSSLEEPANVRYLLRVYGKNGRFDETRPRRLDLGTSDSQPADDHDTARLAYGENTLVLHNIPTQGGSITVSGRNVPTGDHVTVQGLPIPLDDAQRFVARFLVPRGPQHVEVEILNDRGEGLQFKRNLSVATDDSFFVGIADLTAGARSTSGPVELVTGDRNLGRHDYVDGQLAFYYKGLVKGEWLLTAAADTRDRPIKDLFSNFARKDPQDLLRRIDPNKYYPVYGDDATTVQDAPTSGKFYVRLEKGDSSVLWGDFQTQLTGTDFIQYARTLYGLDVKYRSPEATTLGERKRSADAFWAEPGTLQSRQEFRGTGGSLYTLQHQDISIGSEQVWVQTRDRDSGIVTSVTQLVPAQDYDVNYMQGRILLHKPLSATADSATAVRTGGLDGDPLYLVVTYEYIPDFSDPGSLALGGHASQWFGDHFQLGVSAFHQGDEGERQDLRGVDGTWRYKPGTYVKSEYAHSNGTGTPTLTSITGGLSFNTLTSAGGPADAGRVEAAVDLSEVTDSMKGRAKAYYQDRGANFSGPGRITGGVGVRQAGASSSVPINDTTQVAGKFDSTDSSAQTLHTGELAVEHRLDEHWRVAVGTRIDDRQTSVANASPILSQNGSRTDVTVTVGYRPQESQPGHSPWDLYGFVQGTATRTDTRPENDRSGFGGSYQVTDAMRLGAEASDGSLGFGAKASTDYRIDDRSNVYLNYTLAADQPDALNVGRSGTLTTGTRYRYNDATSVYGEERMQTGTGPTSLTQAYGVDFAPSRRWTYGLKVEHGKISDPLAGDLSLTGLGATLGYTQGQIKYNGALEWRHNDSSLYGGSHTGLARNSLSYQVDPAWKLFGKLNWSQTEGQANTTLNAEYHEVIVGAAWRPVRNDRWNTLFKFTILEDQPSLAQVSSTGYTADYAQQSRVFDIDTTYETTKWLSLGLKYAIRNGNLKPTQSEGEWYSSQAQLWILRGDILFPRRWDALVELRRLEVRETDDHRTGVLLGAYRHLGEKVKIGVGYNFTDYSDNLTDVSYRSHGFFINTVAQF